MTEDNRTAHETGSASERVSDEPADQRIQYDELRREESEGAIGERPRSTAPASEDGPLQTNQDRAGENTWRARGGDDRQVSDNGAQFTTDGASSSQKQQRVERSAGTDVGTDETSGDR